jgi:alkylation response protein AidB-like acyl-CoA dehydrogenase
VLDGTKTFITNGPVCDVFTVIARTGEAGMTAFILERGTPGLSVGRELDKMGNRSSPTGEMVLESVRVPDEQRLGEVGTAQWAIGFECFSWERTVMLGSAVGGMQRTLDDCIAYAKQREAFGKPIAHFQSIAHKLAEMKIRLESARLMLRYGAWKKDQGLDHQVEASMAKAHIGECALANADAAIQIHGGWGYVKDFPVERAWRDAKLSTLGGGTTEIQKVIISRSLLAG